MKFLLHAVLRQQSYYENNFFSITLFNFTTVTWYAASNIEKTTKLILLINQENPV